MFIRLISPLCVRYIVTSEFSLYGCFVHLINFDCFFKQMLLLRVTRITWGSFIDFYVR